MIDWDIVVVAVGFSKSNHNQNERKAKKLYNEVELRTACMLRK